MNTLLAGSLDSPWPLLGTILLAAILGGLIGLEREFRGKSAGFRTNMLICLGSALLTAMSMRIAAAAPGIGDPGRIASYVVGGIGFLGAGVIWQSRGEVNGMTTAATIWVVAAIGITVAGGQPGVAAAATAFVLLTLAVLGRFEIRFENRLRAHVVHLTVSAPLPGDAGEAPVRHALRLLSEAGLEPSFIRSEARGQGLTQVTCSVRSRKSEMEQILLGLTDHDPVKGLAMDPE